METHFLSNRWTVLVACIWIECCAGASYSFSLYSQTIKTRFGYTQQQLDIISVLKDTGECIGIVSGLLYDRFPPWLVLLVGAGQNSLGYVVIWLFVTGRLAIPAVWKMCLFICVAINGQTYYNTASIVTCVNNFPENRGIVVGLMKGCLGLSSAILSTAWRVVFPESDGSSFLLVAAIVPSVVALVLMPIVRKYDPLDFICGSSTTMVRLGMVSAPVVVLALFLMGFSFWDGHSFQADRVEFAVALIILAAPLWVAWKANHQERTSTSTSTPTLSELLITNKGSDQSVITEYTNKGADQSVITEHTNISLWGELCSFNFFLVLFTSAIALGSGYVALNNMGQVATALGFTQHHITIFVTLISVCQFFGRFGFGIFSDYLLSNFGVARPLLTAMAGLILCCGYMLIVMAGTFHWTMYLGSIVIGLAFGANWCLNPATVSELFGLAHFGTLYNVMQVGIPMVSYVLSVWVAGYLYDSESGRGGQCRGSKCFKLTFIILASVCVLAVMSSSILWWRTRHIYRKKFISI
ncbi:hypothetical protein SUGI_0120710 [Cryptomeria japonica]|uniref:protein NUCLEAR FUSION DEFECTIVE 4 n=1 Tax=Cryptomeria japonica TaxID=3369 RepID=UPI002408B84C|nr:protein NUCLEAR FUSION DEFECTIVE 4 [Cryptomeria japonica]GLJ10041.1 hypothetical protein SUGI_0120710 [Cryptomeria japonica]